MATKYGVFVSSAARELRLDREVVIKAILTMGHVPISMELFDAASEVEWRVIADHIKDSDYFCTVLAHKYGRGPNGGARAEREFNLAVASGVPVFGLLLDDGGQWPGLRIDTGQSAMRLTRLRELAESQPVRAWSSWEDLSLVATSALSEQIAVMPRTGWSRPSGEDESRMPAVDRARPSEENASGQHGTTSEPNSSGSGVTDSDADVLLRNFLFSNVHLRKMRSKYDVEGSQDEFTVLELFGWIAPMLLAGTTSDALSKANFNKAESDSGNEKDTIWRISESDAQSLLIRLLAFGWVTMERRGSGAGRSGEYWILSNDGRRWFDNLIKMQYRNPKLAPS